MKPVTVVEGVAAPLPRANVDTDQIIPKQFLKRIERDGYGPFLFYDWARDIEGEPDAGFVLNKPQYRGAKVLVAGANFGCGSSREHAAWALQDWGFEAIIAPSFGDIFRSNACNVGLLPVVLAPGDLEQVLAAAERGDEVRIDLEAQTIGGDGLALAFDIDPHSKHKLLNGLDAIGETMQLGPSIDAYEATRPSHRPSLGS
jgi:3-isopropylmalate/(R)-2-methylmalate dehydratase small subunit